MDDFEKALQDAPWNSDLLSQAMAERFPGVRHAYSAQQVQALTAAGYQIRAVTRNPFYPDEAKPALYLSPMTAEEKQERSIGSELADMASGQDMKDAGLRQ